MKISAQNGQDSIFSRNSLILCLNYSSLSFRRLCGADALAQKNRSSLKHHALVQLVFHRPNCQGCYYSARCDDGFMTFTSIRVFWIDTFSASCMSQVWAFVTYIFRLLDSWFRHLCYLHYFCHLGSNALPWLQHHPCSDCNWVSEI